MPGAIVLKSGCWQWVGQKHSSGYGRIRVGEKRIPAHKWIYGEVPEGKELHHICRNKACINPIHLVAVTRSEHKLLEPSSSCAAGLKKKSQRYCDHGHLFDEVNTYHWRGHRRCRKCHASYEEQRRKRAECL